MRTLLLSFLLFCCVSAAPPDVWQPECYCRVELVDEPHDADTLTGKIYLPFGGLVIAGDDGKGVKIRSDFDAFEVTKARNQREPFKSFTPQQWENEFARGNKARSELIELLRGGTLYIAPIPKEKDTDPWERIDARWLVVKDGIPYHVADYGKQHGWLRK